MRVAVSNISLFELVYQRYIQMGIPKFFRWLTRRYPLILKNISREEDCPPIDNLYLDLNGIVHNCIHGNDSKLHERVSRLTDFDEVWANIMKAIDEIVHTVKPKQILFLAVDGVAPRAKMNQQRARRFRAAKDSQMLRDQLLKEGKDAPSLFDSNSISPGTKFMFELNRQLEFFVQYKLNTDTLYQNVVLSDSSVPGEGEHKMMDYIRQAKTQPTYDPNTRHCFYGADADLIMLSLLTHEPNFMIIREEHVVRKIKQGGVQRLDIQKTFNFQLIFISLLREYFQMEYSVLAPEMQMRFDLERVIDDFVFFCFFIGNDFLPSLSALDISEGSLDSLIDLYKKLLPQMTNYISESGKIHWDRAEPFISMLGQHELESFRMRVESIKHARHERIVSFQADFGLVSTQTDRATQIKNKIREKLAEKKLIKIFQLKSKGNNRDKTYKKFLLMKRFDEDQETGEESKGPELSKRQKEVRQKLIDKYRKVLIEQASSPETQSEGEKALPVDHTKLETLKDIVSGIKVEYFSDLNIDDIGDQDVSDVDEGDIDIDNAKKSEQNAEMSSKLKVQEQIIDKYSEQNLQFMTEFISLFSHDSTAAKAFYYQEKLKVDVNTESGLQFKRKMLKKYLEGLQWVLYYYYRGAQHWRWYYPYHYAPMISDIDESIVQSFLSGRVTIEEFEIDANCSDVNVPYTPFQQLLSIMPTKSIGLLPEGYATIAANELIEYFPAEFDIDLNGRALPWEASCLIPFVDEKSFIDLEKQMLTTYPINEEDARRNQVYFYFKSFRYDSKLSNSASGNRLASSLKKIPDIENSKVVVQLLYDYQDVGKHSFLPELLPGIKLPCIDFPSFKWIGAISVNYDEKIVNRVAFKRVLIRVPSCPEDRSNEDLESFVYKFVQQVNKEIYMGLPYQIEAFPTSFEDERFIYTLYGDVYTNIYKVHKEPQRMDGDKYGQFVRRQCYKAQDSGFSVENVRTIVSVNRVKDVRYDNKANVYYKIYEEECEAMPLSMIMKRRDQNHYLNMNTRCGSLIQSFKQSNQVLCMNMHLFGVLGKVNAVDLGRANVKVEFNKESEELKIHDPFFGQTILQNNNVDRDQHGKRYMSDQQIERDLKLPKGLINKLTGSFLITFNDREKLEKQVIDLGLNIKNFSKKVHIPDFVRFVADLDNLADNQYDDYRHNQHSRGARHIRKHWEYSEECYQVIKEYKELYGEILDGLVKAMRVNRQILTLKDLFGSKVDEVLMSQKVKEVARWIEKQPLSNLPYVEMGFDALNEDLIIKLDQHKNTIKEQYQGIKLQCRAFEFLQPHFLYQESFPFWCQPYSDKTIEEYRVGDRVININSTRREFVPFGLRGTVVGHTNDKVIVLFDDQYLGGNNIYGHCEDFKGGYINPNYLINLTHKFIQILKKNAQLVSTFQEQPLSGTADAEAQIIQREALLMQQENVHQHQHHHRVQVQPKPAAEQPVYREKEEKKAGPTQPAHRQTKQQQQYVAKKVQPALGLIQSEPQQPTVTIAEEVTEDTQEVYQDLKDFITQVQQQTLIKAEELKNQQPALTQTKSEAPFQDDVIVNDEEEHHEEEAEKPSGFVPNFTLQANPDFQQLMNLMNSFATQIQTPLFDNIASTDLNINADAFVPNVPAINDAVESKKEEESKTE